MQWNPIRLRTLHFLAAIAALLFATNGSDANAKSRSKSYEPRIDPSRFAPRVDHPYFPLDPGTVMRYVERHGRDTNHVVITVTQETKVILGVSCVVVHDQVLNRGRVLEDTFDWYAQDAEGNVWYFGEDTKEFDDDGTSSTRGSWEAGVNGAKPGIIMPAGPAPGKPYRQEYAPGAAEDMGQVVATAQKATVPFGTYEDCVLTKDWSLLEAGTERKWYARGIGCVREEGSDREVTSLVSVTRP